eukprot:UN12826
MSETFGARYKFKMQSKQNRISFHRK